MVQPPFSGPTRFSFGTLTSVKKVSQKGEAPEISLIGRASTPGVRMSTKMNEMPSCRFFSTGDVRASTKIQSAHCAAVIQVFVPLIT